MKRHIMPIKSRMLLKVCHAQLCALWKSHGAVVAFALMLMPAMLAATVDATMHTVQARLARADALGAQLLFTQITIPQPSDSVAYAEWLDAASRIAWSEGEMDRSFALAMQAVVLSERAGIALPPLTETLTPTRAWIDPSCALPLRVVPTGDAGANAQVLAAQLMALAEAKQPGGAWIVWAAKLLDATIAAPVAEKNKDGKQTPQQALAHRRLALLRAACEARSGDVKNVDRVLAELRMLSRPDQQTQAISRWFEGELLLRVSPRRDPQLASLRFVQAAAEADQAPWLRVAALRRAATALESIDSKEAARLRAAAEKETP